MAEEVILELKHITKVFPGVKALSDVSFTLRRATVHAIVGENGAGKSTLMKILSGMYVPDEGEIWLEGKKTQIQNETQGINFGISMIYQELNSVLDMNVMENMFLGRELKKSVFTDKSCMYAMTASVLKELDIEIDPRALMRSLTVAKRQMVEIAKAVSRDARILVMDEPTSSISQREVQTLFAFIKKLKARGVSIIYISHRLEELPEIADELTILRDGALVRHCGIDAIDKDEIIRCMVGRELTNLFNKTETTIGDVVLKATNFSGPAYEHISFELRKGEILGFAGLIGAGRTEVMRAICGQDPRLCGDLELAGCPIQIKSPSDAIRAGIAMVSEDRRRFGLITIRSVLENVSLAHIREFVNPLGLIKKTDEFNAVKAQIDRFRIKTSGVHAQVRSMSGGNQQKVVLAKWMLKQPRVLIMDEPTKGIDVGAKHEIYKLMCELASKGIGIVMISSELPEVLGMSDRIIVMADGHIKGILSRNEATQEGIMRLSAGGM